MFSLLCPEQSVEQYDQQKEEIAKHVKYFKRIAQQLRQKLTPFSKCSVGNALFTFCKNVDDIIIVDKDACR